MTLGPRNRRSHYRGQGCGKRSIVQTKEKKVTDEITAKQTGELVTTREIYGGCPICGKSGGQFDVKHQTGAWYQKCDWISFRFCDEHQTYWLDIRSWLAQDDYLVGEASKEARYTDDWQTIVQLAPEEARAEFERLTKFAKYTAVVPIYPAPEICERCEAGPGLHSSFCRYRDGTLTPFPDDLVKQAARHEYSHTPPSYLRCDDDEEIPF